MAKKKRKPGPSTRPGLSTRPQGRTVAATTDSPSVRPEPASPGGPNRLQRKEDARKQREAVRRRMARRRLYRRGAWILAFLVAAGAIVYFVVSSGNGGSLNAQEQNLLTQAKTTASTAGCSAVQTIKPYSPETLDRTHIGGADVPTLPPLSSYPSVPPTSGPHNGTPLNAGVYADPPPIDQAIHSLEHGAGIIWYDPAALSSAELTRLQTFFGKSEEQNHVIVAPYDYPDQGAAGKLPEGKQMVLVAWHHMQTCSTVSLPVAFEFVHFYATTPKTGNAYKGDAPEAGGAI